ncbi:MAG: hypothetical protein R3D59_09385 [Paracoccaceae bacterium]
MGAAVQALAALTGEAVDETAEHWAPRLERVAEPGPGASAAVEVRAAYGRRSAQVMDRWEETR